MGHLLPKFMLEDGKKARKKLQPSTITHLVQPSPWRHGFTLVKGNKGQIGN